MFEFSERSLEFQERVSRFMDDHVYPNEELHARQVADGDRWKDLPPILEELKSKAREVSLCSKPLVAASMNLTQRVIDGSTYRT